MISSRIAVGTPEAGEDPEAWEPEQTTPQPRRGWKIALVGAAIALFVGLLSYGFTQNADLPSTLIGRRAPNFTLLDMDTGQPVKLEDFSGQPVVLNYWASWCVSCRKEHPNFVAAWERYRDRGVVFLGVLFQDTAENGRSYMQEMGGGWPTLMDPGSRTALDYGVYGVPETFFIGRDGVVVSKRIGPSSYPMLLEQIDVLLDEPGQGTPRAR